MKMKKITKKYIQSVLRTQDQTQVFRLYLSLHPERRGNKWLRFDVAEFIEENAPTKRVKSWADDVRWYCRKLFDYTDFQNNFHSQLHDIVKYTKDQVQHPDSPYAKRPMLGHTHLYFCSPHYGHSDYNKWRALPIKGNERFCDTIIRFADKYFK